MMYSYFQEDSGEAVEYFWQQIKDMALDFRRENKLGKTLKRKKIKTRMEYDFIVDVLVPYQQEGLINDDDADLLNQLLLDYETSDKQ